MLARDRATGRPHQGHISLAVDIAQIAAALTVIGGTVFALLQLREFRRQRQEAVALQFMSAFMGAEFSHAMTVVTAMPDGLSLQELRARGAESERAANLMCTTFESMGVMVFRGIAPFSLVQDLAGGIIPVVWHRLEPWLRELRVEQSNPSDSEWFQWLAEQLERRAEEKVPAYVRNRLWEPRV